MSDDLTYATIATLSAAIAAREVSPVALVQAALDRITLLDGDLQSFICQAPDPIGPDHLVGSFSAKFSNGA